MRQEVIDLLEQARNAINRGEYSKAQSKLDEASPTALSSFGKQSLMYAEVLQVRASLAAVQGDIDISNKLYHDVISILESAQVEPLILAAVLTSLSKNHFRRNQAEDAKRLRDRAKTIFLKEISVRDDPRTTILILELGDASAQADAKEAEAFYRDIIGIVDKRKQSLNLLFLSLSRLIFLHHQSSQKEQVEALFQQAFPIIQALEPKQVPVVVIDSITGLAMVCQDLHRFEDAIKLYEIMDNLSKGLRDLAIGGEYHCISLLGIGDIYMKKGEYDLAEKRYCDAFNFSSNTFGKDDTITLEAARSLADCYFTQRKYKQAIQYYKHATSFWVKHSEDKAAYLLYARLLNNLGVCHDQLGNYRVAVRYYEDALDIRQHFLGRSDPLSIQTQYNLAELARVQQDYPDAEKRFLEVMEIEKSREQPSGLLGFIANNLGDLYTEIERYDDSERLLKEALEIRRKDYGRESEIYARSLESLGILKTKQREYSTARQHFEEARSIYQKLKNDHYVTNIDYLMANLLFLESRSEDALSSLLSAVEGIKKLYGDHDSLTINALRNTSLHLATLHRWKQAREYLYKSFDGEEITMLEELGSGSNKHISSYITQLRAFQSLYLCLLLNDPNHTDYDVETAYRYVQRRKGVETRRQRLLKPGSPNFETIGQEDQVLLYYKLIDELGKLRNKIVRLRYQSSQTHEGNQVELEIRELHQRAEQIEKTLSLSVSNFELYWGMLLQDSPITISNKLPEKSVFIEYVLVKDWESLFKEEKTQYPTSGSHYVAFVIHPRSKGSLKMFDLGDSHEIDAAIREMRTDLIEYLPNDDRGTVARTPSWMRKARYLYNRLIKPLTLDDIVLSSIEHFIIAPDSQLSSLSFELLSPREGELLIDRFTFSYLLTGFEAANFDEIVNKKTPPMILAAPDYNANINNEKIFSNVQMSDDPKIQELQNAQKFTDLKNAKLEGQSVANKLGVSLIKGPEATESVFKKAVSPEIIHIATHGFYLPRSSPSTENPVQKEKEGQSQYLETIALSEDPLERSGLVFAGANNFLGSKSISGQVDDDGILFSYEIMDLDLQHTDMACLSACQTGDGEIRLGEGVQGLRRAFRAAGCRSVISSLWEIPDELELIDLFYTQLLQSNSRVLSLYYAKRKIKEKHPLDPIYWGGIILDGEVGPLRRFNPINKIKIAHWVDSGFNEKYRKSKAQSLYETGLTHIKNGNLDDAIQKFTSVLSMEDISNNLKALALYERAGIRRKTNHLDAALQDYNKLLSMHDVSLRRRLGALADRGRAFILKGDYESAIQDYTDVLRSADLHTGEKHISLVNRGLAFKMIGNNDAAILDYTKVIEEKDGPQELKFEALLGRANTYYVNCQYSQAIQDLNLALTMHKGESSELQDALYLMALCHFKTNNNLQCVKILTSLLEYQNLSHEFAVSCLLYRAKAYLSLKEAKKAKADLYSILEFANVTQSVVEETSKLLKEISKVI
jgi:tetratricopeptide (TPR) repeat protein